jgi:hypothetical protein
MSSVTLMLDKMSTSIEVGQAEEHSKAMGHYAGTLPVEHSSLTVKGGAMPWNETENK